MKQAAAKKMTTPSLNLPTVCPIFFK